MIPISLPRLPVFYFADDIVFNLVAHRASRARAAVIAMRKASKPIDFRAIDDLRAIQLPTSALLNEREIEILTLVARGRTSAQIAHKLKIVKRTVDFHINNARVKLRAANRTEAATRAVAARLIEPYYCD